MSKYGNSNEYAVDMGFNSHDILNEKIEAYKQSQVNGIQEIDAFWAQHDANVSSNSPNTLSQTELASTLSSYDKIEEQHRQAIDNANNNKAGFLVVNDVLLDPQAAEQHVNQGFDAAAPGEFAPLHDIESKMEVAEIAPSAIARIIAKKDGFMRGVSKFIRGITLREKGSDTSTNLYVIEDKDSELSIHAEQTNAAGDVINAHHGDSLNAVGIDSAALRQYMPIHETMPARQKAEFIGQINPNAIRTMVSNNQIKAHDNALSATAGLEELSPLKAAGEVIGDFQGIVGDTLDDMVKPTVTLEDLENEKTATAEKTLIQAIAARQNIESRPEPGSMSEDELEMIDEIDANPMNDKPKHKTESNAMMRGILEQEKAKKIQDNALAQAAVIAADAATSKAILNDITKKAPPAPPMSDKEKEIIARATAGDTPKTIDELTAADVQWAKDRLASNQIDIDNTPAAKNRNINEISDVGTGGGGFIYNERLHQELQERERLAEIDALQASIEWENSKGIDSMLVGGMQAPDARSRLQGYTNFEKHLGLSNKAETEKLGYRVQYLEGDDGEEVAVVTKNETAVLNDKQAYEHRSHLMQTRLMKSSMMVVAGVGLLNAKDAEKHVNGEFETLKQGRFLDAGDIDGKKLVGKPLDSTTDRINKELGDGPDADQLMKTIVLREKGSELETNIYVVKGADDKLWMRADTTDASGKVVSRNDDSFSAAGIDPSSLKQGIRQGAPGRYGDVDALMAQADANGIRRLVSETQLNHYAAQVAGMDDDGPNNGPTPRIPANETEAHVDRTFNITKMSEKDTQDFALWGSVGNYQVPDDATINDAYIITNKDGAGKVVVANMTTTDSQPPYETKHETTMRILDEQGGLQLGNDWTQGFALEEKQGLSADDIRKSLDGMNNPYHNAERSPVVANNYGLADKAAPVVQAAPAPVVESAPTPPRRASAR